MGFKLKRAVCGYIVVVHIVNGIRLFRAFNDTVHAAARVSDLRKGLRTIVAAHPAIGLASRGGGA